MIKFIRKVLNIFWSFHKAVVQKNLKYQNIHKGQTCLIFGNGGSLKYYDLSAIGEKNFSIGCTYSLADKRMLLTRLGDRVRITGFADFFSKDSSQEEERISQLFSLAKDMAPQLADFNATELEKWAGVRPLTPSSIPIIGPSNNKGIYINSGQGFYGWTLACASGFRLAEFFK